MAEEKSKNIRILIKHLAFYSIPFLSLNILFPLNRAIALSSIWAIICHSIIDLIKYYLLKDGKNNLRVRAYFIDQGLHIITLLIISRLFTYQAIIFKSFGIIEDILIGLNLPLFGILKWILALVLVYKPSNITFIKMFSTFKPRQIVNKFDLKSNLEIRSQEKLRTGGIIGLLEKIIILFFLNLNQPMAAGLVLTAKSIARYDKISKNPNFAEYYLIGTLTSILMVILIQQVVFVIL